MAAKVFELETSEFDRAAKALSHGLRQDTATVLRRIAKNFVKDCVKFTPPFGEGTSQESFAAQRRIGVEAVRSDIEGMFRPFGQFDFDANRSTVLAFVEEKSTFFNRPENAGLRQRTLDAIKGNRWDDVRKIFQDTSMPIVRFRRTATEALHDNARNRYGRVVGSYKSHPYFVAESDSIKRVLKENVNKVGMAKGGWAKAAAALGLSLPRWITRHGSPGVFEETKGGFWRWPSIVVGNAVPFIQDTGKELRIIKRAMDNRIYAMRKELEIVLEKRAKKANRL